MEIPRQSGRAKPFPESRKEPRIDLFPIRANLKSGNKHIYKGTRTNTPAEALGASAVNIFFHYLKMMARPEG